MAAPYVFELQADLCKAMSSPVRIQVLHTLRDGPQRVSDIAKATGLAPGQVSRHVAVLRTRGVVAVDRQGRDVVYRIANPKIAEICDLMRAVLAEQASHYAQVSQALGE
jgi:ArsR family transcriptional regulator